MMILHINPKIMIASIIKVVIAALLFKAITEFKFIVINKQSIKAKHNKHY